VLTRIEINGFKTFRGFALDVPPFLVVLGRNASGKSNLFDAIQFLGYVAQGTLIEATTGMRGDFVELFHRRMDGSRMRQMRFAVETLVPRTVTDSFGDIEPVAHTRLRYELRIELRTTGRGERPYVIHEAVRLLRPADDHWARRLSPDLREAVAVYGGSRTDPLDTVVVNDRPTFVLTSGRRSRGRQLPADEATATVLSSLTTASEFPLLYAMKRELQSWRLLQLDPAALRRPSGYDDPDTLTTGGANLPNVLRRMADDTATADRPDGVLSDVVADLAAVIPGVRDLQIVEDQSRRQRYLEVTMRGEANYSARLASDGTLRALALLTALYDDRDAGLICFEEPENGMYPGRLVEFLGHLRRCVDLPASLAGEPDPRPRQLVVSSHSPAVLRALSPVRKGNVRDDIVFVDTVTRVERSEARSRVSRVRWLRFDDRSAPPVLAPDAEDAVDADIVVDEDDIVSDGEVDEFEVRDKLDRCSRRLIWFTRSRIDRRDHGTGRGRARFLHADLRPSRSGRQSGPGGQRVVGSTGAALG
jgi:predicted ATPase